MKVVERIFDEDRLDGATRLARKAGGTRDDVSTTYGRKTDSLAFGGFVLTRFALFFGCPHLPPEIMRQTKIRI